MEKPKSKFAEFCTGATAAAVFSVVVGVSLGVAIPKILQPATTNLDLGIRIVDAPDTDKAFLATQAAKSAKIANILSAINGTSHSVEVNSGAVAVDFQVQADGTEVGSATKMGPSNITYSIVTDGLRSDHIFLDHKVLPLLEGGTAAIDKAIANAFDDVVTDDFLARHRDLIENNPAEFAESLRAHVQEQVNAGASSPLLEVGGMIKLDRVDVAQLCKSVSDLDDMQVELPESVCVDASSQASKTPVGDWMAERQANKASPGIGKPKASN